jgi:hypothetical protein
LISALIFITFLLPLELWIKFKLSLLFVLVSQDGSLSY